MSEPIVEQHPTDPTIFWLQYFIDPVLDSELHTLSADEVALNHGIEWDDEMDEYPFTDDQYDEALKIYERLLQGSIMPQFVGSPIHNWLRHGGYHYSTTVFTEEWDENTVTVIVGLKDKEDATLFKLTWM